MGPLSLSGTSANFGHSTVSVLTAVQPVQAVFFFLGGAPCYACPVLKNASLDLQELTVQSLCLSTSHLLLPYTYTFFSFPPKQISSSPLLLLPFSSSSRHPCIHSYILPLYRTNPSNPPSPLFLDHVEKNQEGRRAERPPGHNDNQLPAPSSQLAVPAPPKRKSLAGETTRTSTGNKKEELKSLFYTNPEIT